MVLRTGMFERLGGQRCLPVVAVEVRFSKKYDDLVVEMWQWLHKTNSVNAVILLNIDEIDKPNPERFQDHAQRRVQRPFREAWRYQIKGEEYDRQ